MIVQATRPRDRTLPGWGKSGTDYANVNFRSGILQTLQVIETIFPSPNYSSSNKSTPIPTRSRHASPLAKYLPLLTGSVDGEGEKALIPKAMLPILNLYEKHLEDAKWKEEEPTEQDYEECLRIVAVLVDVVGKRTASYQAKT